MLQSHPRKLPSLSDTRTIYSCGIFSCRFWERAEASNAPVCRKTEQELPKPDPAKPFPEWCPLETVSFDNLP